MSNAVVTDIAYHEDKLHALVAGRIVVEIGADGRATKTYDIPDLRRADLGSPFGLASAGGKLYTIAKRLDHSGVLFEITLK